MEVLRIVKYLCAMNHESVHTCQMRVFNSLSTPALIIRRWQLGVTIILLMCGAILLFICRVPVDVSAVSRTTDVVCVTMLASEHSWARGTSQVRPHHIRPGLKKTLIVLVELTVSWNEFIRVM